MPDRLRILSSPLRVAGGLDADELACVVAADALVRRAWAAGSHAAWFVTSMAGDQGSQYALERDLAREGHDRATLPAVDLEARGAAFAAARRVAASELLARVGVTVDVGATTTADAAVVVGARTAFVRLFEEGLIEQDVRVVPTCPRCVTVVDRAGIRVGEAEGERLIVRLGDDLLVGVLEPELLPGAVAVGVPEGDARAGTSVVVPLADREVPVVEVPGAAKPVVLVAGHDGAALDIAERHGLAPITVLAADGTVAIEGPLSGLARYAARAAARDLLVGEGVVAASEAATEQVDRCASCGTVLVPLLGRHWFLRFGDLAVAAADAVRDGIVDVTPPDLRDALLGGATRSEWWCLSGTVLGGVPVPVATCAECGKVTVEVEVPRSCGKCMGSLQPSAETIDARFLAALWPLIVAGWPSSGSAARDAASSGRAVITADDLLGWALPALALGIRLATPPFTKITVHPPAGSTGDAEALLDSSGDMRVLRLALVAGDADPAIASAALAQLDAPCGAAAESDRLLDAVGAAAAALDDGAPAQAGALLESALTAGVAADAADRVRALALPILGT